MVSIKVTGMRDIPTMIIAFDHFSISSDVRENKQNQNNVNFIDL